MENCNTPTVDLNQYLDTVISYCAMIKQANNEIDKAQNIIQNSNDPLERNKLHITINCLNDMKQQYVIELRSSFDNFVASIQ